MKTPNFIRGIVRKIAAAFRGWIRPLASGTAAAVLGFVLATEAAPKFAAAVLAGTIMSATAYSEAEGRGIQQLNRVLRKWPKPRPEFDYQPGQNPWANHDSPPNDFLRDELHDFRRNKLRDFLRNEWRESHPILRRRTRYEIENIADCLDKDPEVDYISLQCAKMRKIADCLGMDPEVDDIGFQCARIREKFALETGECSASEDARDLDCRNKWIREKIREECANGELSCDKSPYGGDIRGARRIDDILRNQTPYRQTWEPPLNRFPPFSPESPTEVKP